MKLEETTALELARLAVREYQIGTYAVDAIGDSGAYTFVLSGNERRLLKLHTHARGDLEAAMVWLEAVCRETRVVAPRPIRNRQDRLVTYLEEDQKRLPATLHTWVEGEHIQGSPKPCEFRPIPFTRECSRSTAKMVARLHEQSKSWEIPSGFVRPTWDLEWMWSYLHGLEALCEEERVTRQELALIEEAASKVREDLTDVEKSKDSWGLIHSDLNSRNLIVYGNEVRPLDFDLCGFGFFLQDISYLFLWLSPNNRHHFLDAYQRRRSLPSDHRELLVSFFIFSLIPMLKFWLPNPQLLDETCRQYLQGKLLLFSE